MISLVLDDVFITEEVDCNDDDDGEDGVDDNDDDDGMEDDDGKDDDAVDDDIAWTICCDGVNKSFLFILLLLIVGINWNTFGL